MLDKEEIKEGQLVQIKKEEHDWNNAIWVRIMFIDINETFIGKVERKWWANNHFNENKDYRFDLCEIRDIHRKEQEFCYSDKITICNCEGLCQDK